MTAVTTLLAGIRELEEAATEGPWHWRNTNRNDVYLHGARTRVVMAFSRRGMNGAQPEFRNAEGLLEKAADKNLNDYADAAFIAAARTDVPRLIQALEAVLALADESDIHDQDYGERLASGHVSTDAIRTAITTALGDVEKPFTGFPPTPQHKNKVG